MLLESLSGSLGVAMAKANQIKANKHANKRLPPGDIVPEESFALLADTINTILPDSKFVNKDESCLSE
ncbi:hypothetical protein GBA52_028634 [Prunus armeniaca]|nr:hypothetical protein GBA52_028634 [Prunus armeniaca]